MARLQPQTIDVAVLQNYKPMAGAKSTLLVVPIVRGTSVFLLST